jgi:hypothetical protein
MSLGQLILDIKKLGKKAPDHSDDNSDNTRKSKNSNMNLKIDLT